MLRVRRRESSRTRCRPFFLCRTFTTASCHRCGTSSWCHTTLIMRWNSRSTVGPWSNPSLRSSAGSSSGLTAFASTIDLTPAVTSLRRRHNFRRPRKRVAAVAIASAMCLKRRHTRTVTEGILCSAHASSSHTCARRSNPTTTLHAATKHSLTA